MSITPEKLNEKLEKVVLRKNGKGYSRGSITFYNNEFKKLLNGKPSITLKDVSPSKLKNLIKDKTLSQRTNLTVTVIKLYQLFGEIDSDDYRELAQMYDEFMDERREGSGKISTREKETYQDWDDIIKAKNALRKHLRINSLYQKESLTKAELKNFREYILLVLLTSIPPRRAKDYVMKYVEGKAPDDKYNYLVKVSANKWYIMFNVYKTADTYGSVKIDIPSNAATIKPISNYIKYTNKKPGDWLFSWTDNPISSGKLSDILKETMGKFSGKKSGFNVFRKSFVTHSFKDNKETTQKQKELSKQMGHSVSTQQGDYNKNSEDSE